MPVYALMAVITIKSNCHASPQSVMQCRYLFLQVILVVSYSTISLHAMFQSSFNMNTRKHQVLETMGADCCFQMIDLCMLLM